MLGNDTKRLIKHHGTTKLLHSEFSFQNSIPFSKSPSGVDAHCRWVGGLYLPNSIHCIVRKHWFAYYCIPRRTEDLTCEAKERSQSGVLEVLVPYILTVIGTDIEADIGQNRDIKKKTRRLLPPNWSPRTARQIMLLFDVFDSPGSPHWWEQKNKHTLCHCMAQLRGRWSSHSHCALKTGIEQEMSPCWTAYNKCGGESGQKQTLGDQNMTIELRNSLYANPSNRCATFFGGWGGRFR